MDHVVFPDGRRIILLARELLEQEDCIGVPVQEPYKPEHYRYRWRGGLAGGSARPVALGHDREEILFEDRFGHPGAQWEDYITGPKKVFELFEVGVIVAIPRLALHALARILPIRERLMNSDLQDRIRRVVSEGLSADPLAHAEQLAEIASLLHEAFQRVGLRSTVVGGSAIELHAPGLYVTGDIDLVIERIRYDAGRVDTVFGSLGFQRRGRHWILGDLFVEVPSNALSDPSETMRVGTSVFEIVTKEVVLADRIVGFRQWQVIAWGQQALDLIAAFGEDLDLDWLRRKLEREGSLDALRPLQKMALGQQPITAEVLLDLLEELRGTP